MRILLGITLAAVLMIVGVRLSPVPAAAQNQTPYDRPAKAKPEDKAAEGTAPMGPPPPRQRLVPVGPTVVPEGPAPSQQCGWIGKRVISLLIRDDAMAANDFIPFYERFTCSADHLNEAFGCVVETMHLISRAAEKAAQGSTEGSNGGNGAGAGDGNTLSERIDQCWRNPDVRFELQPVEMPAQPSPAKPAQPTQGPS